MNQIVIIGRLTRDVEMRYVPGTGMPVANFTVAVDRDYKDKDGNRATDFLDVQVWNKQAQSCEQCLSKGSLVCVNGSVRVESYEDRMGNKRRAWRINANRVQFLSPKSNSNSNTQNNNDNNSAVFTPNFDDVPDFMAIDDDMPF